MLSAVEWADYAQIINQFMMQDSALKPIVWKRFVYGVDRYMEDNAGANYQNITINVLLNYNYFRTWPITFTTESGELDRQSVQVIINKQYLRNLGYISADNNFVFNPDKDTIFIDGKPHRVMGDTMASQASDKDLLVTFIAKREELKTADPYSP
jgi:hypothetical protein